MGIEPMPETWEDVCGLGFVYASASSVRSKARLLLSADNRVRAGPSGSGAPLLSEELLID